MAAINLLEKNLEIANLLPQVIDKVVEVSVSELERISVSTNEIIMRSLTPETLAKLQANDFSFLNLEQIKADARALRRKNFVSEMPTLTGDKAVRIINKIPDIQNAQRAISHQAVAFICTSFEAYCKDRFEEIKGTPYSQNVMSFPAIYQAFAVQAKALKMIPDAAALENTLRAIPIDIASLKRCFSYRHVIVHRASILDTKAIQEIGLATSEVGKPLERFSLNDIQTYARAVEATAHWIDTNTK